MSIFQFIGKKQSEKTELTNYTFKNDRYSMTIHTTSGRNGRMEILYPIKVKATGLNIDITPDINLMSKASIDLSLPPSITMEQVPQFKECLEILPGVVDSLKNIINRIERDEI